MSCPVFSDVKVTCLRSLLNPTTLVEVWGGSIEPVVTTDDIACGSALLATKRLRGVFVFDRRDRLVDLRAINRPKFVLAVESLV